MWNAAEKGERIKVWVLSRHVREREGRMSVGVKLDYQIVNSEKKTVKW